MEYRVLGPCEVVDGDLPVAVGGPRQRAVLAILALRASEVVPLPVIVDAVWGDDAPRSVESLLRTYLSRLRQAVGPGVEGKQVLVRKGPGYVLNVAPDLVDAHRFEQLVNQARDHIRDGDAERATRALRTALGLWRGDVLSDLPGRDAFRSSITRLEEMRLVAVENLMDADLELGHHVQACGEIEALVTEHPFRERLWEQLIIALYRSGRQAEALGAYQRARRVLVEEVGVEPGPGLQELERQVLDQAADLAWQSSVEVVQLREVPAQQVPLPSGLVPGVHATTFVGRTMERSWLDQALERAGTGRFGVVFVSGPSGIGKSSLLAQHAQASHTQGVTIVHGRADEAVATPFQCFRQPLQHWVRHAPIRALDLLLPEDAARLAVLAPQLARRRVTALESDARPAFSDHGGDTDRYLLFEAIARWFEVMAAEQPVLLVMDDLQWADPATLLALRHVVRHPPDAGAVLAAAYRDSELKRDHELTALLAGIQGERHVQRIELAGLPEADVAALIHVLADHDLLGGVSDAEEAVGELAGRLRQWTGGNPLFIHETLRQMVEQGSFPGACDRQDTEPLFPVGVPAGVADIIQQRMRYLPAPTATVVGHASVLGVEFDVSVLSHMVTLPEIAAVEALEPAVAAKLVEPLDDRRTRFTFPHALFREAVLDSLPLSTRARAHWHAGQALASVHAADRQSHLDAIAHHLTAGISAGDLQAALVANVEAGERALGSLAFEEARTRFDVAVELLGSRVVDPDLAFRIWLGVGRTGNILADAGRRRTGYMGAAQIAREQVWPERLTELAIGFGAYAPSADRSDEDQRIAECLIDEALACLDDTPAVDRCWLLAIKAVRAVIVDDGESSRARAATALELADGLDRPEVVAAALTARAWSLLGTPLVDELEQALTRARQLPSLAQGGELFSDLVLNIVPVPGLQRGDRTKFDADRAQQAAAPETRRSVHLTAAVRAWDSAVALAEGRFRDTSPATSRPGVASWQVWEDLDRLHRTLAALERGQHVKVKQWMTRWINASPEAPIPRAILAVLHGRAGEPAVALRHLDVLRRRDWHTRGWSTPLILRHLAEAVTLVDHPALATELLDELTGYSGQMLASFTGTSIDGAADRCIGQLLLVLGRVPEAVARLAAGQALEHGFGALALEARTGYWHALARMTRDEPSDRGTARRVGQETLATAMRLGMTQLAQDTRALVAHN